ncbi:nitroreductase family protein [Globicatella sanguinis]
MNEMIKKQLNHRTIRFFKDKQVAPEQLNTILEVINQTASSNALQAFSIIRVTDQEKRSKLAEITKQAYITKVPELFIFVIDNYRNATIAKAKDIKEKVIVRWTFSFKEQPIVI